MSELDEDVPFSRPQLVIDLPPDGLDVNVSASIAECEALARAIDVVSIDRLAARFNIRNWGRHGITVTGTVTADIVQSCIVSLEPIPEHIEEPVEVKFLTPEEIERMLVRRAEAETGVIDVNVEVDDDPDAFDGQGIDLGVLAAEFMVLGMDPYPRKPDAVFDPDKYGVGPAPDEKVSPFAALAQLKPTGK